MMIFSCINHDHLRQLLVYRKNKITVKTVISLNSIHDYLIAIGGDKMRLNVVYTIQNIVRVFFSSTVKDSLNSNTKNEKCWKKVFM